MGRKMLGLMFAIALVATACGGDDDSPALSGEPRIAEEDGTAGEGTLPAGESVSFEAPEDGATVARRFTIGLAAEGIEIEPATAGVHDGAGHFHVMIDTPCLDEGEVIPRDDTHVHFGDGQMEGQLFLEPGEHRLCLQVGDGAHAALPVTDEITVTVDDELPYITLGVPQGETVASPVALTMEAHGVTIEPAAAGVKDGAGHFHVMIDTPCLDEGEVIPKDDAHVHFGDGATSAQLELPPGEHRLCLQVGDGAHAATALTHTVKLTVG